MSESQAVAIYDLESDVEGKLSFKANEVLTILACNVGNGWYQAKNSKSQIGLVPNSYFKSLEASTTPTLSAAPSNITADSGYRSLPKPPSPHHRSSSSSSSSSKSSFTLPPRPPPKPARLFLTQNYTSSSSSSSSAPRLFDKTPLKLPETTHASDTDEWDEEDEEDEEDNQEEKGGKERVGGGRQELTGYYMDDFDDEDDEDDDVMDQKNLTKLVGITTGTTDKYLFDMEPPPIPENTPRIPIYDSFEGPVWAFKRGTSVAYRVHSPRKESKFRGVKNFVNYRISASNCPGLEVLRRYKHFDWLHTRLVEKYSTILVPPLPNKQLSGRFDEDFILQRQHRLHAWMHKISMHPVLSSAPAFKHFVTPSVPEEWKAGKRRVEKDKYKGAFLFYTIDPPGIQLDSINVEIQLDKFGRHVRCMEDSVKHLCRVCSKTAHKQRISFRKEFRSLGTSLDNLSKSFELDLNNKGCKKLASAISYTGKTYSEVSLLFSVQASKDLSPLQDNLNSYKSLLSLLPDVLLVQRSSTNKIQETAGHLTKQEVTRVQGRVDVITYSVLAEIQHFQVNRVSDFNEHMKAFLKEQVKFYNQIASNLKQSLSLYETTS